MKKLVLGILVFSLVLGSISGIVYAQEGEPEFKLISPKQLVSDIKDLNSKRLKIWYGIKELDRILEPLEGAIDLDESVLMEIVFSLLAQDDQGEIKSWLLIDDFEEKLLGQNLDLDQFEQEFNKIKNANKKLIIEIKKKLDPSQKTYQETLKKITKALQDLENPNFLFQGLSEYEKDYSQAVYVFDFIQQWRIISLRGVNGAIDLRPYSKLLNEKLVETKIAQHRARAYLVDKNLDKNSDGFKESFSRAMQEFNAKLGELLQFIETLPEK